MYPQQFDVIGKSYRKVNDLRYGSNPHQSAAFYKPLDTPSILGEMKILKSGKSGLSQSNIEDMAYALNICKYFSDPACVVMKHVNPSGVAVAYNGENQQKLYYRARACDPRAAFGAVIGFNYEVDAATADAIMSDFIECVIAPAFATDTLSIFNNHQHYKRNRHIRIIQCGDLSLMPKYRGDAQAMYNLRSLPDGSLIVSDPMLSRLSHPNQLKKASTKIKLSTHELSVQQKTDLLNAWYITLNVRSNAIVIFKNGQTLAIGTGEQDRVGAIEQALWKYEKKYKGQESIQGAILASDGFFPFPDAIEKSAVAGIHGCIAPAGSIRDTEVIKRANELNLALYYAPERGFSHH